MRRPRLERLIGSTLALVVAAWAAVAIAIAFSDKDRQKKKSDAPPPSGARLLDPLGSGEPTQSGVREPSGVAYSPKAGRLFVVGDEGMLAELDATGKVLRSSALGGNLEDVAVLPTGQLLVLVENSAELVLYDPAAGKEAGRWRLETAELLGEPPRDKANGFEGLAYRDDPGKGGLLYLVHQRAPALVVSLAWDPKSSQPLGASAVRARHRLQGHEDLTAATYVPSLKRLLVIAEKADRLLIVRDDGRVEAEAPLPGQQQEGLCLDGTGALWIADDRAGMLRRLPGALGKLESGLAAASAGR
jgi:uncharacterized protein YjiK